ncbi:hypothetical protein DFP73DRAFT_596090 [Morchella snyderi]|nr:hypothetical protein DFP73DRAFT_596090 [Morchella snyderi]
MFNRMSNAWKGRSRQNQKPRLEVIKDKLQVKKKGMTVTIEIIPEDGLSEDDEPLAADPPNALGGLSGSNDGGGKDEVVHAQLRGIEAEDEGKEDEEEQEEGNHEGGKEEDV